RKSKIQNPKFPLDRIRRTPLRWYQKNRRELPWRRTRDPYAILIAETMLQQTQVRTVLPYYRRFLKAFPTVGALDRASKEKVLALWSGLGYYRRVENLKRAARIIAREHGGKIPRQFDSLRALPGVGAYTAGALMSIAFNRPYPALDGNARRVLLRIFGIEDENDLYAIASRAARCARPGEWNQALMELGATICVARNPHCPLCPVRQSCAAWRRGRALEKAPSAPTRALVPRLASLAHDDPERGPTVTGRGPRRRVEKIQWPLLVIQKRQKVLLRRRPAAALLNGLWELPGGERQRGESLTAALTRHLNGLGSIVDQSLLVGEVRHSITHRRIRAPVFLLAQPGKEIRPGRGWRWAPLSSLRRYPLSSLSLKAIKLATER
ncbi:MAG: A/G-specific adenine glycosylase, partial [Deltaproteobacteria bacterium]|nr:A/G-specific adenine glycosylase [Deltaproteobacteria bacterium]